MIIEAPELGIIKSKNLNLLRSFLTFLGLDENCLDNSDNLKLASLIDTEIKKQINAKYAELWREVLELAKTINQSSEYMKPNTQTIKFILDNKDKLLHSADGSTIRSMLLTSLVLVPLSLVNLACYAGTEQDGEINRISTTSLLTLSAIAIAVFIFSTRVRQKNKAVKTQIENNKRLNIKRFVEILEKVYQLRLLIER